MIKLTDLRLGQKILVFVRNYSSKYPDKFEEREICELSLLSNGYYFKVRDSNGTGNPVIVYLSDYKNDVSRWHLQTWCFPNNTKYVEHVKRISARIPEKPKIPFKDYDKYPHDNNTKQVEAKLEKQRAFATKIMEQGCVWYVTYQGNRRIWAKKVNPRVYFRGKNYFIDTPCGPTCANKEGKTLRLDDPCNADAKKEEN